KIGDNQAPFFQPPVLMARFLFLGGFLAFAEHGEAEFPQDIIRLAVSLAAAELIRLQDSSQVVATGQPYDRFWRVAFAAFDEFIAGGRSEGMVDAAVEVVQRLDDVLLLQTWRNRLRHDTFLAALALDGRRFGGLAQLNRGSCGRACLSLQLHAPNLRLSV